MLPSLLPVPSLRHDEVAFCTLACQTHALLAVAEAQQQQKASQESFQLGESEHAFAQESGIPAEQRQLQTTFNTLPPLYDRQHQQGSEARPPVPAATATHHRLGRPPLQSRHSLAVVNNLVSAPASSSSPPSTIVHHPIMNSLRSDIFSVSSVAQPLAGRSAGGGAPPNGFEGMSPTTSARTSSSTTTAHHASQQPSFFSSPLSPRNRDLDPVSSAESLYRQHYPKFASRRHLREHSPNKPPYMSDSLSSSTISDAQLLTPPSVIRPLLVLPELPTKTGHNPPPPTPASPLHSQDGSTDMSSNDNDNIHAVKISSSTSHPTLALPLLRHTPERRSAPRRSLEISPSNSQQAEPKSTLSSGTEIVCQKPPSPPGLASNILRPGLRTNGSFNGRSGSDTPFANGNSLELDIQHVESVDTPPMSSASPTPPIEVNENMEPGNNPYLTVNKAKISNPVSPPKLRSRLISMHTAPTGARRELNGSDGWRSVEASRYTLGPREANYIVKKLSEEQKKRQQKERALAKEEAMDTRGRSRVRKRAGSWGNSLAITQSMACKSTYFVIPLVRTSSDVLVSST